MTRTASTGGHLSDLSRTHHKRHLPMRRQMPQEDGVVESFERCRGLTITACVGE